ncbi:hypothetical protein [Paenibacillus beijingensis]|nr:hypothetical protein [Paenibacillus beijingensis]
MKLGSVIVDVAVDQGKEASAPAPAALRTKRSLQLQQCRSRRWTD